MSHAPAKADIAEAEVAHKLQELGDLNAEKAETHATIVNNLPDLVALGEQVDDPDSEFEALLDEIREMQARHTAARDRAGDLARFYWAAARLFMTGEWRYQDLRCVLDMLETTPEAEAPDETRCTNE